MPWFPEFASAVELARTERRSAGHADPVGQYFAALTGGHADNLEAAWPGEVVIYDPRAGEIRGHRQLRRFVASNQSWLAERRARTQPVASTRVGSRAVVELLAYLQVDGAEQAWPLAVVAESPDDQSVVFRTYCSQWPVDGRRHLRPPILAPAELQTGDVVARYHAALGAGSTEEILTTFEPNGYFREPIGLRPAHRGTEELAAFFAERFNSGGIELEHCAITDDGVRCALEYNLVRWGRHQLAPQAGIAVYERGTDGLLAAVRVYDDIEQPVP